MRATTTRPLSSAGPTCCATLSRIAGRSGLGGVVRRQWRGCGCGCVRCRWRNHPYFQADRRAVQVGWIGVPGSVSPCCAVDWCHKGCPAAVLNWRGRAPVFKALAVSLCVMICMGRFICPAIRSHAIRYIRGATGDDPTVPLQQGPRTRPCAAAGHCAWPYLLSHGRPATEGAPVGRIHRLTAAAGFAVKIATGFHAIRQALGPSTTTDRPDRQPRQESIRLGPEQSGAP